MADNDFNSDGFPKDFPRAIFPKLRTTALGMLRKTLREPALPR